MAGHSSDPDPDDTLSYAWDLDGDGIFDESFSAQATWTYTSPGPVTARLRVTDPSGEFDADSVVIDPGGNPPQATIDAPAPTITWAVGDRIDFRGSATDPQDGALPSSRLSWTLLLQHCTATDNCHTHPVQTWDGVAEGSFVAPDHSYPSHLELRLTATEFAGQTNTRTIRLDPRTVDLTFRSAPSGLRLAAGGQDEANTPHPHGDRWLHELGQRGNPTGPWRDRVQVRLLVGRRHARPRHRCAIVADHLYRPTTRSIRQPPVWWRRWG